MCFFKWNSSIQNLKSGSLLIPVIKTKVSAFINLRLCICKTVVFPFVWKSKSCIQFPFITEIKFWYKNTLLFFSLEVHRKVSSENFYFSECYRKPGINQSSRNRLYWLIFRSYFVNTLLKMGIFFAPKQFIFQFFDSFFCQFLCKRRYIFWILAKDNYFIVVAWSPQKVLHYLGRKRGHY